MGRRGDADAEFSEFVAARSHQLYRYALLLTTGHHAAEDLMQTGLAKAYAAWPKVLRANDPVAYVHGIITKSFLSDKRRRCNSELPLAELPERSWTDSEPAQRLALLEALRGLTELDRTVVVLRYWEDRTVADTATSVGLSEAAVKNRCLRALRQLRTELLEPELTAPALSDTAEKGINA